MRPPPSRRALALVAAALAAALLLSPAGQAAAASVAGVATPAEPGEPALVGAVVPLIRTPSAPDAWGGPRTGAEPTRSQRVVDYALTAALDPVTHALEGTARITWRNRSDRPIRQLYAHLYLNAFESEGSTFAIERHQRGGYRSGVETGEGEWGFIELRTVRQGGRDVPWTFVHPDGGPASDHTVARLDLPAAVPPGGAAVLEVTFHDRLPRVVARTGWFGSFHLVGQWYPKLGVLELPGERGATAARWNCHEFHLDSEFYADFGAYDLEVVVPPGVTVGASGVPVAAPTTAADGVHHRFRGEDVHDAVFTAWDGFAPPLVGATVVPGGGEVQVEVLAPPEYARGARAALQATLDALRWYSAHLGTYPYPKVTVVLPPFNATEAGGMEYETFFTTDAGLSWPFDSADLTRYVTIHEFGHGYFMGLLASNEFEEPFLDEGMNEWTNVRMLQDEVARFPLPAAARWLGLPEPTLDYWTFERISGTGRFLADPLAAASWGRWSGASYGRVYSGTVLVMHDLGQLVGEAVADRALQAYYRRWRFRHPSAADLREAFVEAGADRAVVEAWFDQQVYGAAPVDDRIVEVSAEEVLPTLGSVAVAGGRTELGERGRDAEVERLRTAWKAARPGATEDGPGPFPWRSVVKARRFAAAVPRILELTFDDGTTERIPWPAGQPWGRWERTGPARIASARLDAAGPLFLDLDLLDDARTRKGSHRGAVRVGVEAAGWLQLLLAALETL
jgi:hypothetical protein